MKKVGVIGMLLFSVSPRLKAQSWYFHKKKGTATIVRRQENHQAMLRQLGITALRPGASGDETAPNHPNYD